jgi:Uma2 family endonuclease
MAAHPQPPRWSVDAYLEMERGSPIKHDYLDGHVYAMAGGSRRHSRIGVNVTTVLGLLVRGGPYQVFNSDMKVRVQLE